MIMSKSIIVKARVRIYTEFGKNCLAEIRCLKEGVELEGVFNTQNNAFDFKWNGEDAMLWVGHNAEVITPHWEEASARAILRNRIHDLHPGQCMMLSKPINIMYQGACDEVPHPVKITMVGRYGKLGHCKLVSEVDQLYSLNEATPEECLAILNSLSSSNRLN